MNNSYILILLLFILLSCSAKSPEKVINITPDLCKNELNFLDYLSELEFITFDNSLIIDNSLAQLRILDSTFIFTTYSRNKFYFVPINGRNKLKAPNYDERVPLRIEGTFSLAIDYNNKYAYLSDRQGRIFKYNATNNKINNVKTDLFGHQMTFFNDKLIIINNDIQNGILKVVDPTNWTIEREFLQFRDGFNFSISKHPIITLEDGLLLSISGSDTIYFLSSTFNLNAVASIGKENSSIANIDFREFRSNLLRQGDNYSPDNFNLLIPEGEFVHFNELYIISLYRHIRQILWNRRTNNFCICTPDNHKFAHILFENAYINLLEFHEGFYYTTIRLDGYFYEEALEYVRNYDNNIAVVINEFLEEYPNNVIYENPVLVRFSLIDTPY